jgi:hypothetical protein
MQKIAAIAIAAVAIVFLFLVARSGKLRSRGAASARVAATRSGGASGGEQRVGGELVAVIAAAVSAASGMAPGSFRIAGISPSAASTAERGFNTPVWGHVDRFKRGEGL